MNVAVAAHRHPAHALCAAGDHHIAASRGDFAHRDVDRRLRGAAFSIHRHAGYLLRPARAQEGRARDVAALLTDLRDTSEDHVIDYTRLDPSARDQPPQYQGTE